MGAVWNPRTEERGREEEGQGGGRAGGHGEQEGEDTERKGEGVTHFTKTLTLFICSFFQMAWWGIYFRATSQILDGYWNSPTILRDLREV